MAGGVLAAIRRQLFGAPVPRPRAAKPYDYLAKAQLWSEVVALRAQLADANRAATLGRNAIQTIGTEGTAAYRQLADARETLRSICALTEERR